MHNEAGSLCRRLDASIWTHTSLEIGSEDHQSPKSPMMTWGDKLLSKEVSLDPELE